MFINDYSAPLAANMTKEDALPVVTVRNPYDWMLSMCHHPYTTKWNRSESGKREQICPHLVYTSKPETLRSVPLTAQLANQTLAFDSLAHLWNDWYLQYEQDADFPVR
jgi:N-acetylmuramoyl-L-alanine amidase CwlA